jgi:hypothetical protein
LQQDPPQATGNVGNNCDRPHPIMRKQAEFGETKQHAIAGAGHQAQFVSMSA